MQVFTKVYATSHQKETLATVYQHFNAYKTIKKNTKILFVIMIIMLTH